MNRRQRALVGLLVVALVCPIAAAPAAEGPTTRRKKVMGLDKVIAFTYVKKGLDVKALRSVTFVEPTAPADWKYWADRGAVPAIGKTWFDLLRNPAEKSVDILLKLDYGGNPKPAVSIDEFGFDFGGQTDAKSADILRQTKKARPELSLTVWEMRGPIPKVLGDAYRDVCDLIMLECYVGHKKEYWWIASQVQAARAQGILDKTIVALGLGKGGNPGEIWATTKEELEQQIRFVRLVAPESPGIGFFAAGATEELMAQADELCAKLFELPADGTGLPADVVAAGKFFLDPHEKATLVCCPEWVEPDRGREDPGKLVEPKAMRACILNLGRVQARDVEVRLRNPKDKGGDVFAAGKAPVIPAGGQAIVVLPVTAKWNVWKTWEMKVDAPACEVRIFKR